MRRCQRGIVLSATLRTVPEAEDLQSDVFLGLSTVTAALIWVLRAYIAFYAFVGLFVAVLIVCRPAGPYLEERRCLLE